MSGNRLTGGGWLRPRIYFGWYITSVFFMLIVSSNDLHATEKRLKRYFDSFKDVSTNVASSANSR